MISGINKQIQAYKAPSFQAVELSDKGVKENEINLKVTDKDLRELHGEFPELGKPDGEIKIKVNPDPHYGELNLTISDKNIKYTSNDCKKEINSNKFNYILDTVDKIHTHNKEENLNLNKFYFNLKRFQEWFQNPIHRENHINKTNENGSSTINNVA